MDLNELKERQGWTLLQKVDHSLGVIDQFLSRLDNRAYVSFSGGKDSTVLLDLCRIVKPDIKVVFCNTGNEYPDIVRFVRELKNTEGYNIEIIYPEMKPAEVMGKYGFPLVSKEQSQSIYEVRHTKSETLRAYRLGIGEAAQRPSVISRKWRFLIDEDFDTTHKCCSILKKAPFRKYERETGLFPILGIMADESALRRSNYIRNGGCNVFADGNMRKRTESLPLSIWLEGDIWSYIAMRKLKIADIYGKGAKRTGCMFCGFGCHHNDDNRLQMCHDLYPKMYEKFMGYTNNGVTYRDALRKVLAVNGLYLPDERPEDLFSSIK